AAKPARCSSQVRSAPAARRIRCTAGTWSKPAPPPCTSVTRRLMARSVWYAGPPAAPAALAQKCIRRPGPRPHPKGGRGALPGAGTMVHRHLASALQGLRRPRGVTAAADGTDRQLLRRFVAQRDEAMFAALLHRHGPLVLEVCRQVLRRTHDAEDAFQATLLGP